jgi:peptide chain release factor
VAIRVLKEMSKLNIKEEDIVERFVRSSGPGGQNVNKTSTCVHLKHLPTGLEVKCQQERSQAQNRYLARKILAAKVSALFSQRLAQEQALKEKLRRKARKRSLRAKERLLEAKRRHSRKKSLRAPISYVEE